MPHDRKSYSADMWTNIPRRSVFAALVLVTRTAAASEGDVVITADQLVKSPVTLEGNRKVIAYGPVPLSKHLQTTKDTIFIYLEGATFGGHAGGVEFYFAFPPKDSAKKEAP